MAFPVGTYTVTLGNNAHANFAGSLVVTSSTAATYQRGQSPAVPVTFTSGTSPNNWIQFTLGKVDFGQAPQVSPDVFSGNVSGLHSLTEGASDTWTATTIPPTPE
jgi:hypothetical protein